MSKRVGQFYIYRNPTPSSCEVLTRQINDNLDGVKAVFMPIQFATHTYLLKYKDAKALADKLGASVGEYPASYYVTLEAAKQIAKLTQKGLSHE